MLRAGWVDNFNAGHAQCPSDDVDSSAFSGCAENLWWLRWQCRGFACLTVVFLLVMSVVVRWHACVWRSFRFVSPTVCNSLPSDVQSNPSQATFKSRLKTHLFNIAFNDQPELWCCVTSSAPQDLWHWHLPRYKLDFGFWGFSPLNVSPLRGEKPQNRPLSKLNTGRLRCAQCCRKKTTAIPEVALHDSVHLSSVYTD